MITFPNAKINLGLYITGKRPDGYHNIESIFYPVPLCDALEIVESDQLKFTTSGLSIPGEVEGNLCLKAYHLLAHHHPQIKEIHIHLRKNIPMGAGLGGGSADGAFMINLLNDFFKLNLPIEERENYAAQLGSDCPFFIENNPKLVTGRGEKMKPIPIDLSGWYIAIVSPGLHISTKEAYGQIVPSPVKIHWESFAQDSPQNWHDGLVNHFEAGLARKYPEIQKIKSRLYNAGAGYAAMTGSGSSVFGLFKSEPDFQEPNTRIIAL